MHRPTQPVAARTSTLVMMSCWLTLAATSALGAAPAAAQERPDREAPSQRLASDPERTTWDVALTVDALGPLFGRYGAQLEVAPVRWGSLALGGAWRAGGEAGDVDLAIGARWWPLGEGLEGGYLGPAIVTARRGAGLAWGAEVEVGWQFVWDGWVVAAGARCGWPMASPGATQTWDVGARLALGRAWR